MTDNAADEAAGETPDAREITHAIGDELRRARAAAGWSRPDLVRRMKDPPPVNTYGCWEQGIRACPTTRLVEICDALDISAADLLALALQRIGRVPEHGDARLHLKKIFADDHPDLEPLRQWARNRLRAQTEPTPVARVPWDGLAALAMACGVPPTRLLKFTPDSAKD